jgi:hypothetical protein
MRSQAKIEADAVRAAKMRAGVDYKKTKDCRHCGKPVSQFAIWKHERWCFNPRTMARLLEIGSLTEHAAANPDACWIWHNGQRTAKERPAIHGEHVYVVAWSLANNSTVPVKMYVCHSCDDGWCLNPQHLWVGTPTENAYDMADKDRAHWQQEGPSNGTKSWATRRAKYGPTGRRNK